MRKDAYNYEQKMEQLQKDVKSWKEKHKMEIEEKEFYHKQALDAKRKNKLLKVAIGRLQNDLRTRDAAEDTPMIREEKEKDTDTFLTGANVDEYKADDFNIESVENSQALVEQNLLKNAQVNRRLGFQKRAPCRRPQVSKKGSAKTGVTDNTQQKTHFGKMKNYTSKYQ